MEALVEGFGGGVGGGIWLRDLVEVFVEGFLVEGFGEGIGGRIWWRDLVEVLVEGFGGGNW